MTSIDHTQDTMSPKRNFWDRIADRYAKSPVSDEAAYQRKLEVTRGYLRPDMEVLELGCGTGSTAIVHAPFVKHIHAVDISKRMLEIASDKVAAAKIDNITFEHAAFDDFPAPNNRYDVVLALSFLHLVEDKQAALAEIHHLLKPGGLLVSSTVCLAEKMRWFKIIAPIGKALGLLPVVKVFTAQELEGSVTAAGFAIDHHGMTNKDNSVFIVAQKAG